MAAGIYLVRDGEQLIRMANTSYETEDHLQGLIARYPSLLAGDDVDSGLPARWLLIGREVGIPSEEGGAGRWAADHLLLDQDGVPTIVEVKRSSDTRIRREVVGQVLEYAANIVSYCAPEELRTQFTLGCEREGRDPDTVLTEFLGEEQDPEKFWQTVTTNLQAGRIRLLFVADEIPPELQRIVEFLNQQMNPAEVLAVEVKQYVGEGIRTLVPRILGQTTSAQARKDPFAPGRQWDAASFFEDLEARHGRATVDVARHILDWANASQLRIQWGKGKVDGSFIPVVEHGGSTHSLIAVWTYGRVEIQFEHMLSHPPFDAVAKRHDLLERLRKGTGIGIPDEAIAKRPSIPLSNLVDRAKLDGLLEALGWALGEIRAG